MPRRTLLLAALLLAAPALFAQKVTLTPFPMDGTFASTTVQDMTMVMSVETDDSTMASSMGAMMQEMQMAQTIDATLTVETDATGKRVTTTTDRMAMKMHMPGQNEMTYDSADPDNSTMPGPGQNTLIGQSIVFRVEGDSLRVQNLDEVIDAMLDGDDEETRARQRAALEGMFDETLFEQMLSTSLRMLPETAVGPGDTFDVDFSAPMAGMGDMTMQATFTVESVEGTTARYSGPMTVTAAMQGNGMPFQLDMEGTGTIGIVYDAATGEQETTSDMTMSAQMDMAGMTGGTEKAVMHMLVSMKQTQTVTRK